MQQQREINELKERVSFLEAAVQALLQKGGAPLLPNVEVPQKPSRFASILGLKKGNGA
jgi:hypothetical protein